MKNVLVTGGAGFIGSHLCERLLQEGCRVVSFDDLSLGKKENLPFENKNLAFVQGDILDQALLEQTLKENEVECVFHFAAEPDVRKGNARPGKIFQQNVTGTQSVLEACRNAKTVKTLVFASTSTVYGNCKVIPTPESAGLEPVSHYGLTKLEGETLCKFYVQNYALNCCVLRFANIIGGKSGHGVIFDFVEKLRKNPEKLEILGDGTQSKSYLHVSDCVEAILIAWKNCKSFQAFNVGSDDRIKVVEIAEITKKALGFDETKNVFTGGKTGWIGDVPVMLLDCAKIKKLGWKPKLNSRQAVEKTVGEICAK